MNTSIKEVEPPAKRTRRSLGLRGCKKESVNDYAQPHENKKEFVERSNEKNQNAKKLLKFVYNNLCDRSKYISALNKEVKDIPKSCSDVLKCPLVLQDIKRKIAEGKIMTIDQLQLHLLMLSYNAVMINRTDSIVYSDASNFQSDIEENCRELEDVSVDNNVSDCQAGDMANIRDYSCVGMKFSSTESEKQIIVNKDTIDDILNNFIDKSEDEYTDSENDSDAPPPKKKRKKNISDSSNSESD